MAVPHGDLGAYGDEIDGDEEEHQLHVDGIRRGDEAHDVVVVQQQGQQLQPQLGEPELQ